MREFQAITLIKSLVGFESETGLLITDANLLASEKELQTPANSYQCTIKQWIDCVPKVETPKTFEDQLNSLLLNSAQSVFSIVKTNAKYKKDYFFEIKNNGATFDKIEGIIYPFEITVKNGESIKFSLQLNGTFADTVSTAVLTVGKKEYHLPQAGGTIITDSLEAGSYDCSLQVYGAHAFKSKSYSTTSISMDETPLIGTLDIGVDFEAICSQMRNEIANAMIAKVRATMLVDCNMSVRSNASQRSAEIAIEKQSRADEALKAYNATTSLLAESVKKLDIFNVSKQPTVHTL